MSKKQSSQSGHYGASDHSAEYKLIKHDLIKVFVLNLVYLAAILAAYYSNRQSHFLENWFSKFFHF